MMWFLRFGIVYFMEGVVANRYLDGSAPTVSARRRQIIADALSREPGLIESIRKQLQHTSVQITTFYLSALGGLRAREAMEVADVSLVQPDCKKSLTVSADEAHRNLLSGRGGLGSENEAQALPKSSPRLGHAAWSSAKCDDKRWNLRMDMHHGCARSVQGLLREHHDLDRCDALTAHLSALDQQLRS